MGSEIQEKSLMKMRIRAQSGVEVEVSTWDTVYLSTARHPPVREGDIYVAGKEKEQEQILGHYEDFGRAREVQKSLVDAMRIDRTSFTMPQQ